MQCYTDETMRLNNLEQIHVCYARSHNMCHSIMSVTSEHLSHVQ